jgi:hypothetical protein
MTIETKPSSGWIINLVLHCSMIKEQPIFSIYRTRIKNIWF